MMITVVNYLGYASTYLFIKDEPFLDQLIVSVYLEEILEWYKSFTRRSLMHIMVACIEETKK